MRIGLSTPAVMVLPGVSSAWERAASAEELVRVAVAADEAGLDFLTCAEHIAVPESQAAQRGLTYWDPLSTLSFLAAHTNRIRLATAVLVLGYHHPLEIAKRYGTLDRLSGGRLVLGVGVGSLREEFDLLDAPFEDRGDRADDALAALRASLSTARPRYQGRFYSFDGVAVEPCAVQDRVPIWVGGRTVRSLRRAIRLADGWMPYGLSVPQLAEMIAHHPAPEGFEVVLPTGRPVDPIGAPGDARHRLQQLREAGATAVTCTIAAESVDHFCRQLPALRELASTVS